MNTIPGKSCFYNLIHSAQPEEEEEEEDNNNNKRKKEI